MKLAASLFALLAAAGIGAAAEAQVPYIEGTWELNAEASQFPGPAPQTHVRSYRLRDDGFLVGVAVIVDAQGAPRFLQIAAKPDGTGYPEWEPDTAAQWLIDKSEPTRTYAESPTDDPRRIEWIDRRGDVVLFSGERWVTEDGQTMSFTVHGTDQNGEAWEQLYVFRRTGE
jgi:hypothetical protein